jgi:hypothetical protein
MEWGTPWLRSTFLSHGSFKKMDFCIFKKTISKESGEQGGGRIHPFHNPLK